jgi:hypothetical protein
MFRRVKQQRVQWKIICCTRFYKKQKPIVYQIAHTQNKTQPCFADASKTGQQSALIFRPAYWISTTALSRYHILALRYFLNAFCRLVEMQSFSIVSFLALLALSYGFFPAALPEIDNSTAEE